MINALYLFLSIIAQYYPFALTTNVRSDRATALSLYNSTPTNQTRHTIGCRIKKQKRPAKQLAFFRSIIVITPVVRPSSFWSHRLPWPGLGLWGKCWRSSWLCGSDTGETDLPDHRGVHLYFHRGYPPTSGRLAARSLGLRTDQSSTSNLGRM